jgi:hypothetical protein
VPPPPPQSAPAATCRQAGAQLFMGARQNWRWEQARHPNVSQYDCRRLGWVLAAGRQALNSGPPPLQFTELGLPRWRGSAGCCRFAALPIVS